MAGILASLDAKLGPIDVGGLVSQQAGALGPVSDAVSALTGGAPDGLQDLLDTMKELPMPKFPFGIDLSTTFGSARGALPSDLSSVSGDLMSGLQNLSDTVSAQFGQLLAGVVKAVSSLADLTQIDFRCEPGGAGSEAPGEPEGGGGAPGGAPGGAQDGGEPPGGGQGGGGGGGGPGGGGSTPSPTAQALDQVKSVLDLVPPDLSVDTALAWLVKATDLPAADFTAGLGLPLIDDVRDALVTLLDWKQLDASGVAANLAQSLGDAASFVQASIDAAMSGASADLAAAAQGLHVQDLGTIADGLASGLAQIKTAVAAGDLSGTSGAIAQLGSLLDQLDSIRPDLDPVLAGLPALAEQAAALPRQLEDQVEHVVSVLGPAARVGPLPVVQVPPGALEGPAMQAMTKPLSSAVGWLQDLLAKLDIPQVSQALETVVGPAMSAIDDLETGLVAVTTEVQHLFGQVQSVLDQVDVAGAAQQVEQAIQGFSDTVVAKLGQVFEPVRTAIHAAVDAIGSALGGFDPQAIADGMQAAMQAIGEVLGDPAVTDTVKSIHDAVSAAAQALGSVSFSSVCDDVVDAIEGVTDVLQAIPPPLVTPPIHDAIAQVLGALPKDLAPITDPLVDDLNQAIEQGPSQFIETAKDAVATVVEKVEAFDPAKVAAGEVSTALGGVVEQMQGFQPSALLAPVREELESLKDRVRQAGNPGALLEPFAEPFAELMEAFGSLDPDALLAPLDEAVQAAVNGVLDAIPAEDALDQLGATLQRVADVVAPIDSVVAAMQRIQQIVDLLSDPDALVDAWLDPILDELTTVDVASIEPALSDLKAAIAKTKAAELQPVLSPLLDPAASMGGTAPQVKLAAVIQAYLGVSPAAVAALHPDSAEKADLTTLLGRFDPSDPEFGKPWTSLGDWAEHLGSAGTSLTELLQGWDARFHADGTVLGCLAALQPTGADLRQFVGQAADDLVRPVLRVLFGMAQPVGVAIQPFATEFEALAGSVHAALDGLVGGPASLQSLTTAAQGLIQRLRDFNLGFLRDAVGALFTDLEGKLKALDPSALGQALDQAFEEMLSAISLDLLIAPADLAELDQTYASVLQTVEDLDPEKALAPLRDVYDNDVKPLVKTLDVTEDLQTVLDSLQALQTELPDGVDRVNKAYKEMLNSVPAPMPISIDVGADLGVSL